MKQPSNTLNHIIGNTKSYNNPIIDSDVDNPILSLFDKFNGTGLLKSNHLLFDKCKNEYNEYTNKFKNYQHKSNNQYKTYKLCGFWALITLITIGIGIYYHAHYYRRKIKELQEIGYNLDNILMRACETDNVKLFDALLLHTSINLQDDLEHIMKYCIEHNSINIASKVILYSREFEREKNLNISLSAVEQNKINIVKLYLNTFIDERDRGLLGIILTDFEDCLNLNNFKPLVEHFTKSLNMLAGYTLIYIGILVKSISIALEQNNHEMLKIFLPYYIDEDNENFNKYHEGDLYHNFPDNLLDLNTRVYMKDIAKCGDMKMVNQMIERIKEVHGSLNYNGLLLVAICAKNNKLYRHIYINYLKNMVILLMMIVQWMILSRFMIKQFTKKFKIKLVSLTYINSDYLWPLRIADTNIIVVRPN